MLNKTKKRTISLLVIVAMLLSALYGIKIGYSLEQGFATDAVTVSYRTHVQSIGWQGWAKNGAVSGTSGRSLRLEGIQIKLSGNSKLGIAYTTHVQSYGWLPWVSNGEVSGSTGESKRLEAIKIQLTGTDASKYDVYYRVHAQKYGWLGWAKNGQAAGTAGFAYRLEAIQIQIVTKGKAINNQYGNITSNTGTPYASTTGAADANVPYTSTAGVMYKTHVQSIGWQNWVQNGALSGTSGQAKRLEGINIQLLNKPYTGGITYRTHVQTYGWQDWRSDGAFSGTSGEAKRLEAIEIKLTGKMAENYDIYYCTHVQSIGWQKWVKNGEMAGTSGRGLRLEAIQIKLVKKDGKKPQEHQTTTEEQTTEDPGTTEKPTTTEEKPSTTEKPTTTEEKPGTTEENPQVVDDGKIYNIVKKTRTVTRDGQDYTFNDYQVIYGYEKACIINGKNYPEVVDVGDNAGWTTYKTVVTAKDPKVFPRTFELTYNVTLTDEGKIIVTEENTDYKVDVGGKTFLFGDIVGANSVNIYTSLEVNPEDITIDINDGNFDCLSDMDIYSLSGYNNRQRVSYHKDYEKVYHVPNWDNAIAQLYTEVYQGKKETRIRCHGNGMKIAGSFYVSCYYKGQLIQTLKMNYEPYEPFQTVRERTSLAESACWAEDMTKKEKMVALHSYISENYTYNEIDCKNGTQMMYFAAKDLDLMVWNGFNYQSMISYNWNCGTPSGHTYPIIMFDDGEIWGPSTQGNKKE